MPLTYKSVDLFGGAIVAEVPEGWEDVSQIRQVPDTQEVFLSSSGFSSIVFDILERVFPPPTDIEALKFHLSDIVESDASHTVLHKITSPPAITLSKMPSTPVFSLLASAPTGEKMRGRPNEPDFVAIVLILVRLENVGTDLVVSVNLPHIPGTYVKGEVDPDVEGKRGS
ncbi:putative ran-interacting Mog1 protein [Septoria linicola]|nr:putative ran-interacting Mog1 protein [Septoria linicola]